MYILLGNCITEFELQLSEACLNRYYVQFTNLYGKHYICFNSKGDHIYLFIYTGITSTTMNAHLLTHLPFYVRAWGPFGLHHAIFLKVQMVH